MIGSLGNELVKQYGIFGILLIAVGYMFYAIWDYQTAQRRRDEDREAHFNQMVEKIISMTEDTTKVIATNTEVFKRVADGFTRFEGANTSQHKDISETVKASTSTLNDGHRAILHSQERMFDKLDK